MGICYWFCCILIWMKITVLDDLPYMLVEAFGSACTDWMEVYCLAVTVMLNQEDLVKLIIFKCIACFYYNCILSKFCCCRLQEACNCGFLYWHRVIFPTYLSDICENSYEPFRLHVRNWVEILHRMDSSSLCFIFDSCSIHYCFF